MTLITGTFLLLVPLLVAVYTFNYARWAWRHKLRGGAVGLSVLALAVFVFPATVIWYHA